MSYQIICCPHCGNDTGFDPDTSNSFCEACGKSITLKELLAEDADQIMEQADKAYSATDYLEAYSRYGDVLAQDPENYLAYFRKGLCAGHLSAGRELRIREVMDGYQKASRILDTLTSSKHADRKNLINEQNAMRSSLISFAVGNYKTLARIKSKPVFDSKREAEQFAASVQDSIKLLCEVDKTAKTEDEQKTLYSTRIEACDLGLKCSKLRYRISQTDSNGECKDETVSFSAGGDLVSYAKKMRKDAVNSFNDLPSIQAEAERLQSGIDTEKSVIKDYRRQRNSYLRREPEQKKLLRMQQLITFGATLVLIVLFVILAIKIGRFWLWIAAAASLLIGWAVFRILTSRFEKDHFPDTLLKLRSECRRSKKALRKKKSEQSKFKNKTMKK